MSKKRMNQFYCFSPPVMMATLTAESAMVIYTFWRYKLDDITKLAIIILFSLASFQLAEYYVCTGYGSYAEQWSRIGFIMISTLPPLGIHLMHKLADKPRRRLVYSAYASMVPFMAYFLTYHGAFIGHQCTGNYVIFQLGDRASGAFALFYYGWLAAGIYLGIKWANELKEIGKAAIKQLDSVKALIICYFVFLVPTAVANSIKPETRRGIPSIMCGFAILFALILTFYIVPRAGELKLFESNRLKKV